MPADAQPTPEQAGEALCYLVQNGTVTVEPTRIVIDHQRAAELWPQARWAWFHLLHSDQEEEQDLG